jgi:hypothetical protein
MIKALKIKLNVSDGTMGWTHDWIIPITEYYIPDKNIAFNVGGGELHVFRPDKSRYIHTKDDLMKQPTDKPEEIELPEQFVKQLEKFIDLQDNITKRVKML